MVRFKVVLGWWEDPLDGDKSTYTEKTFRGVASGPSSTEALAQIEEYYGADEIQNVTLEYTDDMDTPIYDVTNEEEEAWLTKED